MWILNNWSTVIILFTYWFVFYAIRRMNKYYHKHQTWLTNETGRLNRKIEKVETYLLKVIVEQKKQINAHTKCISDLQDCIDALHTSIEETDNNLDDEVKDRERVQSTAEENEGRINNLETRVEDLSDRLD